MSGAAPWALALALAAPAEAPAARPQAGHDVLVVGLLADPLTLDPQHATDLVSVALLSNICETLVRPRLGGTGVEPALATSWATLDNRRFTFTLRERVRFHDGTPFDADAVVANLEALARRGLFAGHALRIGHHAVELTLDEPNAALLATLSQPVFGLQSPRVLAAGGRGRPVGTGPFRLEADAPGRYELAADAGYWGGAPRLARVIFERLDGEQALIAALAAGRVDVTTALGLASVSPLRGLKGVTLDSQTGLNLAFLSVNNQREPFARVAVRQALAKLIDRAALVSDVLAGHGLPAGGPLPPALGGTAGAPAPDLPAARRLLARWQQPQGLAATLLVPLTPRPYLPEPARLAARLQADLAAGGVRIELRPVPSWQTYLERCTRGDYELALLGWQADTLDPNDFLSALLSTAAHGRTNRSRYSSAEMDRLLARGRRTTDPAQRAAVYRAAQALFQRDLPWVPLYHASIFTAYRTNVHGLSLGPTGRVRYDKTWKAQ